MKCIDLKKQDVKHHNRRFACTNTLAVMEGYTTELKFIDYMKNRQDVDSVLELTGTIADLKGVDALVRFTNGIVKAYDIKSSMYGVGDPTIIYSSITGYEMNDMDWVVYVYPSKEGQWIEG